MTVLEEAPRTAPCARSAIPPLAARRSEAALPADALPPSEPPPHRRRRNFLPSTAIITGTARSSRPTSATSATATVPGSSRIPAKAAAVGKLFAVRPPAAPVSVVAVLRNQIQGLSHY